MGGLVLASTEKCWDAKRYFELVDGPTLRVRWALEHHLASVHQPNEPFGIPGFCGACDRAVTFSVDFASTWTAPDGITVPNWRESMVCPRCNLNARQRMIASLVREECALPRREAEAGKGAGIPRKLIYIMEQATPLYEWCRDWVSAAESLELVGSEYVCEDDGETTPDNVRREDAERLSFGNDTVDLYISCDVLEHVNDPWAALRELGRVLRPGGRAILTFPMDPHKQATVRRA